MALLPFWAKDDSRYRRITMDDGLPSNAVRNIVQDDFGFIWFGTDNGLCRYDGTTIQQYRIPELGTNQYISALLSSDRSVIAGTDKGVFIFDFSTQGHGKLNHVPIDIHSTVTSLAHDKEGNLWVSTMEQGVWCIPENKPAKNYNFESSRGAVAQIFIDRDNQIWALTNWGGPTLQRLNRLHDIFEPIDLTFNNHYNSLRMLQTKDGRLWLGSWENGLLLMHSDGHLEKVLSPTIAGIGLHIHTLFERSGDCICIGCDDGVICFNTNTREWYRLLDNNQNRPNNLGDRFVYAITKDNEGGLWIGTFYGGINYVSPVGKRFEAFSNDGGDNSPVGNVISRFCEDKKGHIWIASDDGGLMCYSPKDHRFLNYPHKDVLSRKNAHALCLDSYNNLWLGTYTDGVMVLNVESGSLKQYMQTGDPKSLDNSNSYDIYLDSYGKMWVATMEGLNLYDYQHDNFTRIGKTGAIIIDIDEDKHGNLWLSTLGEGLWCYNRKSGKLKQYTHTDNNETTLPHNEVNCAHVDGSGKLWVATLGGLCAYDSEHDNFKYVSLDGRSQSVMSIIEDNGALWLATNHGILKYVPGEGIQQFTREDGLVGEQAQPNAAMKASNGQIYIGTTNGFSTFYPYRILANSVMPHVYITSLAISNKQEFTNEGLPVDLSQTKEIVFGYDDAQMVSFSYAALSYCSPEKNQYAYKLEGFDHDWNYVGNQTKATYTNLPAGSYTLRVKATNNDGIWSDKEAVLKVIVHPPFWWSWYAKLFYIALIIAAIWYYVHLRLKRADQRHQQEMQRLNEQKEKEVREARLNFFTMIAHEIRTPVSLIIGPLEKIMKKGNASDDMKVIDRNAHRLLELVNQLLDFRKVEQQSLIMHFAPQNIHELIESVGTRFAPTFEQTGKSFTIEYPDEHFTAIVDKEALTKVVSNLLTNANKYTKDEVRLSCLTEPDGEHFRIVVADNGVGILEEDRKRIFEPFFQAQDNKPGTGIGLNIVKSIVDRHHGMISVESEVGKGSVFTVLLPVAQTEISNEVAAEEKVVDKTPLPMRQEIVSTTTASMLIVDDSEDMVDFLRSNFGGKYQVMTAGDGIEALDILSKNEISIIISDWMMPRMDGAEFCRQVRRNPLTSHIPFVMLTAKTDDDSKVEGMDVGADTYIEKPFSVQYLEACIRNILEMRRRFIEKFSTQPLEPVTEIASNPTDNEFLCRMNKLIEENFSNPDLNVNFLADKLNISRSGLFAKIKTLADITPNEMIQMVRLKRAAQLLQENKYTVSEIGYMVGFSNPSYFSKCFQKQFGIRPVDFMKQNTLLK